MKRKAHIKNSGNTVRSINSHINFSRESKKSTARKDPTEVICVRCKQAFILPFKPRNPEIYCNTCFKNKKKKSKSFYE